MAGCQEILVGSLVMADDNGLKDEAKTPCYARCRDCAWVWVVAYAPMLLTRFAALLETARCPRCGTGSFRIHFWSDRVHAEAALEEQKGGDE